MESRQRVEGGDSRPASDHTSLPLSPSKLITTRHGLSPPDDMLAVVMFPRSVASPSPRSNCGSAQAGGRPLRARATHMATVSFYRVSTVHSGRRGARALQPGSRNIKSFQLHCAFRNVIQYSPERAGSDLLLTPPSAPLRAAFRKPLEPLISLIPTRSRDRKTGRLLVLLLPLLIQHQYFQLIFALRPAGLGRREGESCRAAAA